MLKPSQNPPCAWPIGKSICEFAGLWWAVPTKSRNEKALAHDLVQKDISYFLPMTWKVHYNRGRKTRSLLPLFGGYLFFCGTEEQRVELLRTNRAASLIEIKDQQKFLSELMQIEQAVNKGANLAPHRYVKEGQLCRVTSGPLADLRGIALKTGSCTHLVLRIDMLGQAASLEIDSDIIELIE